MSKIYQIPILHLALPFVFLLQRREPELLAQPAHQRFPPPIVYILVPRKNPDPRLYIIVQPQRHVLSRRHLT